MARSERLETTVIPVTRAIPWRPVTHSNHLVLPLLRPERSHFRHFVTQRALAAAQDLVRRGDGEEWSGRGLLAGRLHRCPRTHARFAVVERVLPLGAEPGDDAESARAAWFRRQVAVAEGDGECVIGWVRGSASVGHRLSLADEALHLRCFPQPYHVALSIGDGVGGILAYEAKVACTFLVPFHELLDREIRDGDDAPPATVMDWVNYESARPVVGLRPEERRRLASTPPAAALPAGGLLGTALGSIRGLMGGPRP